MLNDLLLHPVPILPIIYLFTYTSLLVCGHSLDYSSSTTLLPYPTSHLSPFDCFLRISCPRSKSFNRLTSNIRIHDKISPQAIRATSDINTSDIIFGCVLISIVLEVCGSSFRSSSKDYTTCSSLPISSFVLDGLIVFEASLKTSALFTLY